MLCGLAMLAQTPRTVDSFVALDALDASLGQCACYTHTCMYAGTVSDM